MPTSPQTNVDRMIVPYIGEMNADGSANYQYVQQETYQIAGVDYEFDVTLDVATSEKLLKCFDVSGKGIDGGFDVALVNQADAADVLADVINGGGGVTAAARVAAGAAKRAADNKDATAQLVDDLHAGLVAAIAGDGLNNSVENLNVTEVVVSMQSAAGAADMASHLAGNNNYCKLLYTQIPPATLALYMDASGTPTAENSNTRALPLKKGDKLTFVWDVDLSNVVPNKTQVDITFAGANTPIAPNTGGVAVAPNVETLAGYSSALHYDLQRKRIAFNVQLSSGGDRFAFEA